MIEITAPGGPSHDHPGRHRLHLCHPMHGWYNVSLVPSKRGSEGDEMKTVKIVLLTVAGIAAAVALARGLFLLYLLSKIHA